MATLTSHRKWGDIAVRESDPAYGRINTLVTNSDGTDYTIADDDKDPVGQYLMNDAAADTMALAIAGDEASITGLIVQGPRFPDSLAAGADLPDKYAALVRGEAVINRAALPTRDVEGATVNLATVQTALEGLGFVVLTEPSTTTTQTS